MSIERIAYTVSQAAEAVGLSRYVLYDAIRAKELAAHQANEKARILILAEDLRAWVTRMPAQPRKQKSRPVRRR
jgi:excisionase family DNA binding protein